MSFFAYVSTNGPGLIYIFGLYITGLLYSHLEQIIHSYMQVILSLEPALHHSPLPPHHQTVGSNSGLQRGAGAGDCTTERVNARAADWFGCSADSCDVLFLSGCAHQAGGQGRSPAHDRAWALVPEPQDRVHGGSADGIQAGRWRLRRLRVE